MLKASNIHTCVLYDPKDGQIIHVHREMTVGHGLKRTEAEVEAKARMLASKPGRGAENLKGVNRRDIESLRALFVKDTLVKDRHYKVDTATSKLVAVELPRSKR
jgi:hypothetical protein